LRWKPGPPKFYPLPGEPDGIQVLGEDAEGRLLIGWLGGIHRLFDGKTESYLPMDFVGKFRATKLLRDRDGGLWIGTQDRGLIHEYRGKTNAFGQSDGLSGQFVNAFFEDREGSIWAATTDGLDRFRDFAVATFTVKQGLSKDEVTSVLATPDGSVWLGTDGGLNRWTNGHIEICRTDRGRPDGKIKGQKPNSLFQDHRGRIWISTLRGIGYLENDRFVQISGIAGGTVLSMAEDTAGNLWIASETLGLFQLFGDRKVQHLPWGELGHRDHASVLGADPVKGGLWLGFFLGGIAYWSDGQIRASYTAADGLGEGHINHLRVDPDGTLWAATEGGLSRLKDYRIATLSKKNGLPCDAVYWAIEDDSHSVWLYMPCGLVRIARAEMDAWIADADHDKEAKRTIQPTVFDSSDGVRIRGIAAHYSPQVARSADGKLWFLPAEASVIDPSHLPFNRVPPPVHVEQFIADRKTYDATSAVNGRVQLPALIRDLEIDYTALSLAAPEKVLFRYKLEGKDSDWLDAGNRRQAFYNDLPPRNYRFRVMACNNSGVWNEAGTFVDFAVAPAYYQTTWFRVLSVAALLILLGGLYRLRVRQVAQQVRGLMEERLDERERIARDLHDTLLQSVQGLIIKFHVGVSKIRHDETARVELENALDRADAVLAEGRDRVRNLRSSVESLKDLPAAFKRVAKDNLQGDATFSTVVEGNVRELHPLVLEESYCIGREALNNALTHSKGTQVQVEITYDPRQFRLRVRDNGNGVDPKILEDGGRPGHWGLPGMRERSERVGGQLMIWSGEQTGTEIELTVPGATAYQKEGKKPRNSWFRRSSSIDAEQL
jgi:signal transduction histidine kinase